MFRLRQLEAQSQRFREVADKIKQRRLIAKELAKQDKRRRRAVQREKEEAERKRVAAQEQAAIDNIQSQKCVW